MLVAVGNAIGGWWTLGLLLLFVVAGLYLVRRESGRAWKALRQAVDTGRMPGRELADASLVLLGGVFLVIPGFISDVVGIFLILPFTRTLSRRLLAVLIGSRMPPMTVTGFPGAGPGGYRPRPAPGSSGPSGSPGTFGGRGAPGGPGTSGGRGAPGGPGSSSGPGGTGGPGRSRGYDDIIEGEIIDEDPPPGR